MRDLVRRARPGDRRRDAGESERHAGHLEVESPAARWRAAARAVAHALVAQRARPSEASPARAAGRCETHPRGSGVHVQRPGASRRIDIWEEELGQHYYTLCVSGAALERRQRVARRAGRVRSKCAVLGRRRRRSVARSKDSGARRRATTSSRVLASGERSAKELDIAVILAAIHTARRSRATTLVHDPRMHATLARLEALFEEAYPINRNRAAGAWRGDGSLCRRRVLLRRRLLLLDAGRGGVLLSRRGRRCAMPRAGSSAAMRSWPPCGRSRRRAASCRSSSISARAHRLPRSIWRGATLPSFRAQRRAGRSGGLRCCAGPDEAWRNESGCAAFSRMARAMNDRPKTRARRRRQTVADGHGARAPAGDAADAAPPRRSIRRRRSAPRARRA